MSEQGIYHVDIVFCVDASSRNVSVVEVLRQNALTLYERYGEKMAEAGKDVNTLRVRVIAFRDFRENAVPISESSFFELPEETDAFKSFLDGIRLSGGDSGNALEALALALNSDWTSEGMKQRHTVVMMTDAAARPLGADVAHPAYPLGMPADLAELGSWWENGTQMCSFKPKAGRLVVFAPNAEPWTSMEAWNRYWPSYSDLGKGLKDLEMDDIYDILVGSC